MSKYLLDTDIAAFYIRGKYELDKKIKEVGLENCFISEITIAELKFGVESSEESRKEQNRLKVNDFVESINVIPIISCLDIYAQEKVCLKRAGIIIADFDLLIGTSSVAYSMFMVTNNVKHFERIQNIKIINWVEEYRAANP